jgi:hypothetical protein
VQVGTTSLDAVTASIKPASQVFNNSNDTVRALKGKRVDAIVVDLPTASTGTICVIDRHPRAWTAEQLDTLKVLAASAIGEIELATARSPT